MIKNNRVLIIVLSFIFLAASLFQACVKEEYDFSKIGIKEWSPKFGVPIVNSTLTINDILINAYKGNNLSVDNTGFITLVYRGNLFSQRAKEFIKIKDQSFPAIGKNFSGAEVTSFNALPNGATFSTIEVVYTFKMDSLPNSGTSAEFQIDTITFHDGVNLQVDLGTNNVNNPGVIKVAIPGLIKNGQSFSADVPFDGVSSSASSTFNLGGYSWIFNTGTVKNQVNIKFKVELTKQTNVSSSNPPTFSIKTYLKNVDYSYFSGYIGNAAIATNVDTVDIGIFKSAYGGGYFTLVNPSLNAYIKNQFGMNVYANIKQFRGYTEGLTYNASEAAEVDLAASYYFTVNTPDINIESAPYLGGTKKSEFSLNKDNSNNIVSFIKKHPKQLIYELTAGTNYNASGYVHNFFSDTSLFRVDYDLDMPMHGTANDFMLVDTLAWNFKNPENLTSLTIKSYIDNEFPVDFNMGFIFADSLNRPLYTFIPNGSAIVKGAPVGTDGVVIGSVVQRNDFTLPKEAMAQIKTAKKILIQATGSTSYAGGINVKFYNFYKLKVKLGVGIEPDAGNYINNR